MWSALTRTSARKRATVLRQFLRSNSNIRQPVPPEKKEDAPLPPAELPSSELQHLDTLLDQYEGLRRNNSVTISRAEADLTKLDRLDNRWKGPIRQFARSSPVDHLLPQVLTDGIDDVLRQEKYVTKLDHLYREKQHPLWFAANEMPIRYTITRRVLLELFKRAPEFVPSTMLDYGASTGGSLWAAQTVWPGEVDQYLGVEKAMELSKLSQHLATIPGSDMEHTSRKYAPRLHVKDPQTSTVPLTVAAYSLSGLSPKERKRTIDDLWKVTKDYMVIIERGDPAGFDTVRIAREYLLKTYNEADLGDDLFDVHGASVIAPCTHNYTCPMGTLTSAKTKGIPRFTTFCRFAQKINRGRLPAKSPLRQIKIQRKHRLGDNLVEFFSYVIIRKGETLPPFDLLAAEQHPRELRTNERMKSKRVYVEEYRAKRAFSDYLETRHDQLSREDARKNREASAEAAEEADVVKRAHTRAQNSGVSASQAEEWKDLMDADTYESFSKQHVVAETTSDLQANAENSLLQNEPDLILAANLLELRPHELREECERFNAFVEDGDPDEMRARLYQEFCSDRSLSAEGALGVVVVARRLVKEQGEEELARHEAEKLARQLEHNATAVKPDPDEDDNFDWGGGLDRHNDLLWETPYDRGFTHQETADPFAPKIPVGAPEHVPSLPSTGHGDQSQGASEGTEHELVARSTVPPALRRGPIDPEEDVAVQRWARLMGPPLVRGQHVVLDMCTPDGDLERRTVGKSQDTEGAYWLSRKLKWGDITYYTPAKKGVTFKFRHHKKAGKILHLPRYPYFEVDPVTGEQLEARYVEKLPLRGEKVKTSTPEELEREQTKEAAAEMLANGEVPTTMDQFTSQLSGTARGQQQGDDPEEDEFPYTP